MSIGAESFLKKHEINRQEVLYIIKEEKKTVIVLKNGRRVNTIIPSKEFYAVMSDVLVSVNKGVLLSRENIVSIDGGIYLMTDGSRHKGRVRTPGQHKRNREMFIRGSKDDDTLMSLQKSFSAMQTMPLPLGLFEVVFDGFGNPVDYFIRYCNDEMLALLGKTHGMIINRSVLDVCQVNQLIQLSVFAGVARDGKSRSLVLEEKVKDKQLTIHCFRPGANFCACIVVMQ